MSGFQIETAGKLQMDYLVIDSNAIIRGHGLDLYGKASKIVTVPEVLAEIRDSKAKELLDRLPFEVEIKNPSAEMCRRVANFARTTGDFAALSKTDLKLIALTCMLELEVTGKTKLPDDKAVEAAKKEPTAAAAAEDAKPKLDLTKTVTPGFSWAKVAMGDSNPVASDQPESGAETVSESDFPALPAPTGIEESEDEDEDAQSDGDEDVRASNMVSAAAQAMASFAISEPEPEPEAHAVEQHAAEQVVPAEKSCSCHGDDHIHVELSEGPEILVTKKKVPAGEKRTSAIINSSSMNTEKLSQQMRETDDGTGWVNADNFGMKAASDLWAESTSVMTKQQRKAARAKKQPKGEPDLVKEEDVKVACFTTDFSMQNVLLQLGLFVVSAQGMLVRSVKKWVLRCMACFTIQGEDMTRLFCSRCGANHMSRIAVTIDHSGKLKLHMRKNYHVDTMGMKYSLPSPGKQDRFEGELLLREDQLLSGIWRQKVVKINKDVKSAFGEDVTSDVGIQMNKHDVIKIGLGRSNPNAQKGRERRGKKKRN